MGAAMTQSEKEMWTEKTQWAEIKNAAAADKMTLEEFAAQPDRVILRAINIGVRSLALLRKHYPAPPIEDGDVTIMEKPPEARLEVIEALRALVDRLEEIHAHPAFKGVWTLYHVHGGVYDGPTWVEELKRAKKALEDAGG